MPSYTFIQPARMPHVQCPSATGLQLAARISQLAAFCARGMDGGPQGAGRPANAVFR